MKLIANPNAPRRADGSRLTIIGRPMMVKPAEMTPTAVRQQLRTMGYSPIPLNGKRPSAKGWQTKLSVTPAEIDRWATLYQYDSNTGVLTRFAPCIDIDVTMQEPAEALESLAREMFEEGGYLLTRIGKAPKRALIFRTEEPFEKLAREFTAPDGSAHKIEVLGDGQQVVVHGTHPDTQQPYRWHGGQPWSIAHADLPYMRADDARTFLDQAAERLVRDFGFAQVGKRGKAETAPGQDHGPAADIAALISRIHDGTGLHDALRDLAASLIACGLNQPAAERLLRGLMANSKAPRDDRFMKRLGEIGRLVESAGQFAKAQPQELGLLVRSNIAHDPIPPREWAVPERIPARNAALLSGEGAVGKSILLLQLSAATVLSRDWLGIRPVPGPVMYVSCEDDEAEIRRRLEAISEHYRASRAEMMMFGLRVYDFVGRDAVLGQCDRSDRIHPTPLFEQIKREAIAVRPKLIIFDTVADIFGGKENDRAQTRQFIGMLRGLGVESGAAVVLSSHPSLAGIASDTGLSGSTAWHNSVRARGYFKRPDGVRDDTLRVLEWRKNNYGPVGESVLLRWRSGVYVPEPGAGTLEQAAADQQADDLFLDLLRRFKAQGRNASDKKGTTYAPAMFAEEREAKQAKIDNKTLADAMRRLFAVGKLRVVTEGPQSKPRTKIAEVEGNEPAAFHQPSTSLPPPSTNPSTPPPYNPPGGGRWKGGVGGTPPPSTTKEEGGCAAAFEQDDNQRPTPIPYVGPFFVIGLEQGATCVHCGRSDGLVYLIRPKGEATGRLLHEHCAEAIASPPAPGGG